MCKIIVNPFIREHQRPLPPSLWKAVATSSGETILPRLQAVVLAVEGVYTDSVDTEGYTYLLAPSIKTLDVTLYQRGSISASKVIYGILRAISVACPGVETFLAHFHELSPGDADDLTVAAHSFRNIRCFGVDSTYNRFVQISTTHLQLLADTPTLQDLKIIGNPAPGDPLSLTRLRSLHIKGEWYNTYKFLSLADLPSLRSLVFVGHGAQSEDDVLSGIRTLIRFPYLNALEVRLEHSTRPANTSERDSITRKQFGVLSLSATIQLLSDIRALRRLVLDFDGVPGSYAAVDLITIARRWPDLEELHIQLLTDYGDRADVGALIHIARGCSRLRSLKLPEMEPLQPGAMDEKVVWERSTPCGHRALMELETRVVKRTTMWEAQDFSKEVAESFVRQLFPYARYNLARRGYTERITVFR